MGVLPRLMVQWCFKSIEGRIRLLLLVAFEMIYIRGRCSKLPTKKIIALSKTITLSVASCGFMYITQPKSRSSAGLLENSRDDFGAGIRNWFACSRHPEWILRAIKLFFERSIVRSLAVHFVLAYNIILLSKTSCRTDNGRSPALEQDHVVFVHYLSPPMRVCSKAKSTTTSTSTHLKRDVGRDWEQLWILVNKIMVLILCVPP